MTLWRRRKQHASDLTLQLTPPPVPRSSSKRPCSPYHPRVFEAAAAEPTVCIELCKSARFPQRISESLQHDLLADGLRAQTLSEVLSHANEWVARGALRPYVLHELLEHPLSDSRSAALTPNERYCCENYVGLAGAYVMVPADISGPAALLLHLRPGVRPAGNRHNALVCIAAHHHSLHAAALAVVALRAFHTQQLKLQRELRHNAACALYPLIDACMPTFVTAARYLFTARVHEEPQQTCRTLWPNLRVALAVQEVLHSCGLRARRVWQVSDGQQRFADQHFPDDDGTEGLIT